MGFSRQEYWSGLPFPSPKPSVISFSPETVWTPQFYPVPFTVFRIAFHEAVPVPQSLTHHEHDPRNIFTFLIEQMAWLYFFFHGHYLPKIISYYDCPSVCPFNNFGCSLNSLTPFCAKVRKNKCGGLCIYLIVLKDILYLLIVFWSKVLCTYTCSKITFIFSLLSCLKVFSDLKT